MIAGAAGRLVEVEAPLFNLEQTVACGQVFHWVRQGDGWFGAIGEWPVYIEQRGSVLRFTGGSSEIVRKYFALDDPLEHVYATFPDDEPMRLALEYCRGLRLIRQPDWECLATFITSAMKQVPHIAQISHTLRRRYGRKAGEVYTYPTPCTLAALTEADLRDCRLGFRAKNLLGAAKMLASGEVDLGAIQSMDDATARAELCRLPGVGEKVANCALLFGFGRMKAFPIDVWIERVLRELYFKRKRNVTPRRLREFSATHFGEFSGYAQQYLFHHARMTWPRSRKS